MSSFREMLQHELENRRRKNRGYSLRALAQNIDLSPAHLSSVLKGTRSLSDRLAFRIGERLGWDKDKIAQFLEGLKVDRIGDPDLSEEFRQKTRHSARPTPSKKLAVDTFKIVSDWYYGALVELTKFVRSNDPAVIAERLGLSEVLISQALERLTRLGILEIRDGHLQPSEKVFEMASVPSEAVRIFHRQILLKARNAILDQPFFEREFSNIIVAVDQKTMNEIKLRVAKFRDEMMTLTNDCHSPDRIYNLSMQWFRLDTPKNRNGENR